MPPILLSKRPIDLPNLAPTPESSSSKIIRGGAIVAMSSERHMHIAERQFGQQCCSVIAVHTIFQQISVIAMQHIRRDNILM